MTETIPSAPHPLSQTADFSVDVWLVRGTVDHGLWITDNEDGTFGLCVSTADEDGRTYETVGEDFTTWRGAAEAARTVEVNDL